MTVKPLLKFVLLLMIVSLDSSAESQTAATRCSCSGYYTDAGTLVKLSQLADSPLVDGRAISSDWGWRYHPILRRIVFHYGVDVAARMGTPIYASFDGVVEQARSAGDSGNWLLVRYGRGLEMGYAHLQSFARGIRPGTIVRRGDVLGRVGSTGLSTGPHVDIRLYIRGIRSHPACRCQEKIAPLAASIDVQKVHSLKGEMLYVSC